MTEAYSDRIQEIEQEINNLKEVLTYATSEAVYIKDPKKRRKCPVCKSNIYLYYINFEEMFLMCENSYCEFPLGYEALQIVRHENELQENPVKATPDFFEYPTFGGNEPPINIDSVKSVTTTMSSVSDCDRLSQVDPDDLAIDKQEILTTRLTRLSVERRIQQEKNKEVQTNLHRIKELTEEMNILDSKTHCSNGNMIKNKKWLQNLKVFEGETGQKLLTELENQELVKTDPEAPVKELKISVDQSNGDSESPAINIQIHYN